MGFSVVRYRRGKNGSWGILHYDKISPLAGSYDSLGQFLTQGLSKARMVKDKVARRAIAYSKNKVLSPVTGPCQIICQGKNYRKHLEETGSEKKDFNLFFTKSHTAIASAYGNVIRPPDVKLLDYELELGLVIGAPITRSETVREKNLHKYVAGLVMANDISARDIQLPQGQWFKGKSFRTFCPIGPHLFILEREDYPKLAKLNLLLTVNGEKRQEATTAQMMYKPHETLSELSQVVDLMPGDIVLTGTPGGVAMQLDKKTSKKMQSGKLTTERFITEQLKGGRYLQDSDIIRSYIYDDERTIDLGKQELQVIAG